MNNSSNEWEICAALLECQQTLTNFSSFVILLNSCPKLVETHCSPVLFDILDFGGPILTGDQTDTDRRPFKAEFCLLFSILTALLDCVNSRLRHD